jgi:membrane protease YdiL (CAAX protease family)
MNKIHQFTQKIANFSAPIRIIIFVIILLLNWLPMAGALYFIFRDDPNLTTILTMGTLFLEFLILTYLWGKFVYNNSNLFKHYGLVCTRKNALELFNHLVFSLTLVFGLLLLEKLLGLVTFELPKLPLYQLILEGFLSGLGIAFAEELVFRGWLLYELEKDYSLKNSLIINSVIFALLHFLKPLSEIIRTFPAFPGLILLAVILIFAKRSHQNRLGSCIGLHGGFVWGYYIFEVGDIIQYNENISPWITGVDKNPIAGLIGLVVLTILMLFNYQIYKSKNIKE